MYLFVRKAVLCTALFIISPIALTIELGVTCEIVDERTRKVSIKYDGVETSIGTIELRTQNGAIVTISGKSGIAKYSLGLQSFPVVIEVRNPSQFFTLLPNCILKKSPNLNEEGGFSASKGA